MGEAQYRTDSWSNAYRLQAAKFLIWLVKSGGATLKILIEVNNEGEFRKPIIEHVIAILVILDSAAGPSAVHMRSVNVASLVLIYPEPSVDSRDLLVLNGLWQCRFAASIDLVVQVFRNDPHTPFGSLVGFPSDGNVQFKAHRIRHASYVMAVYRRKHICEKECPWNGRYIEALDLLLVRKLKFLCIRKNREIEKVFRHSLVGGLKLNYFERLIFLLVIISNVQVEK